MVIGGGEYEREEGKDIRIDCPACRATGVAASAYNQTEQAQIVGIPVTWRTTWVVCSNCRAHLLSKRNANDLPNLSKEELAGAISRYTSFIARAIALLALLLGWFLIVGPIVALIAVILNRRRGVWRTLSWIGLSLGLLSHAIIGLLILSGK